MTGMSGGPDEIYDRSPKSPPKRDDTRLLQINNVTNLRHQSSSIDHASPRKSTSNTTNIQNPEEINLQKANETFRAFKYIQKHYTDAMPYITGSRKLI
jgi:hypothetical protein